MNFGLENKLKGITASSVEKFLLYSGWKMDESFIGCKLVPFYKEDEPDFRIAVPSSERYKDYFERINILVNILADYYEKKEDEIITAIRGIYSDHIQFRIVSETSKSGSIPLDYAAKCIEGLKDLVLYSACAEQKPVPVCMRANNSAKSSLENFQFGQTQVGSFIINIDVQVVDESDDQCFLEEVKPLPTERPEHRIVKRIETAMGQINRVVNRDTKISALIENGYECGTTANICDAIYKLKSDKDDDITVETTFRYAGALCHQIIDPVSYTFDSTHFFVADEISKRYKNQTLVDDVELTGFIKMLSKNASTDNGESENTIRLLTKVDDHARTVILHLSEDDHKVACDAYRDDREVVVAGTLDKSNKYWEFTTITSFSVVE